MKARTITLGAIIGFSLGMLLAYLLMPASGNRAAGWGGSSIASFPMYCSFGGLGGAIGGFVGYVAANIGPRRR